MENTDYTKKLELYVSQKKLLNTFLTTGALSQAQYDFSLNGLITKLGIKAEDVDKENI